MIRTQKVVVHWLCLKGLRKLGRATTFHTPQATWKLGEWRKIPRASDWSITNCNSTVSTVARETNLGIVVPFETWLKNGHGWLEYSAKNSVWSMCWTVQYRQFFALTNCFISKKGSKKKCGYINIPLLPSPELTASGVKLKNWYFRHMNLPHFKHTTSTENKNAKTKQFHIVGKHLDKDEDFQSCQTIFKMSTLPFLSGYLTLPTTRIE